MLTFAGRQVHELSSGATLEVDMQHGVVPAFLHSPDVAACAG
jgi:hypothetical protein